MSGWQISAIILASGLTVVLLATAYLLAARVGDVIVETQTSVRRVTDELIPTLQGVTVTVDHVNNELVRVDTIAGNVESVSTNISGLMSVTAALIGGPAIKAGSFSYGVRRAIGVRVAKVRGTSDLAATAVPNGRAKPGRTAKRKG